MSRRFEYRRMTAGEYRYALGNLGMSTRAFARITGTRPDNTAKWANGENDIPTWVPVLLGLLTLEGAFAEARQIAAERVEYDRSTGETDPFLED